MKLVLTKTLWGCNEVGDQSKWEGLLARVKSQGFDAIELAVAGLPKDGSLDAPWKEATENAGLKLVAQLHTCWYVERPAAAALSGGVYSQGIVGSESPREHLSSFEAQSKRAIAMGACRINSHSGHDSWDLETATSFLRDAMKISERLGLGTITTHETHRRRVLWNPFQAASILRELPDLRITADLSHWCCVLERIPDSTSDSMWEPLLAQLSKCVDLIHARVGAAETPQVAHPASPDVYYEVQEHERWWASMLQGMHARGIEEAFVEPEFGAPGYQRITPFACTPEQDLWEVNGYMAARVAMLFSRLGLSDSGGSDTSARGGGTESTGAGAGTGAGARARARAKGGSDVDERSVVPAPLLAIYDAHKDGNKLKAITGGMASTGPRDGSVLAVVLGVATGLFLGAAWANRTSKK